MNQRQHLTVVRPGELPPPMLPDDLDLTELDEVMINIKWLRHSRQRMTASHEGMLAAVTLQGAAIDEKPSGSLPSDDGELAYLACYGRDRSSWLAIKDEALSGWTLCADGRYYRSDVSKKALAVWIKRLGARKKADAGSAARRKVGFDPSPYDEAIGRAVAILTSFDPHAPILRNYKNQEPDIEPAASSIASSNASSFTKGSEAKRSEDIDSPERSEGTTPSTGLQGESDEEQGAEDLPPVEIEPFPAGAFEQFWNRFPLKEARKRAQKAFEAVEAARKVSFEAMMAGLERYIRGNTPKFRDWCYPATWLNEERWTSGLPVPLSAGTARGQGPPKVFVVFDSPEWEAWSRHARSTGRLGYPTADHHDGRGKGWFFPTAWPPDYGHVPVREGASHERRAPSAHQNLFGDPGGACVAGGDP